MKTAIITINSMNYGNKLQNYAVYKLLEKLFCQPQNMYFYDYRKLTFLKHTRNHVKKTIKIFIPNEFIKWNVKRKASQKDALDTAKEKIFYEFTNRYMNSQYITLNHKKDLKRYINSDEYGFFIAGSDQIWNPEFAGDDYFFLDFVEPKKRIAFAASIGYETLPKYVLKRYVKYWNNMQYITVREESVARLIEKVTGKKADIFIDPTMLLTQDEWKVISEKPKYDIPDKYILCLFLGYMPVEIVENFKEKYGTDVVILNDKSYPDYYLAGPSQFLYLVEHAELVLTDSFHCTVFSIIFHRNFYVFEREDSVLKNMFTRLESLLERLGFQDRVHERKGNVHCENITSERFDKSDDIMMAEWERVTHIMKGLLLDTPENAEFVDTRY